MAVPPVPRSAAALAAIVALAGCAQLAAVEEILEGVLGVPGGAGGEGQITAQIENIDTRQQAITVQTQDGQRGAVRYDQNTQVRDDRGRSMRVTDLRRGDVVRMHLREVQQGYYAAGIELLQRGGGTMPGGGVQQLQGQVGGIDRDGGRFELTTADGRRIVVALPFNPRQSEVDRFRTLRTGETVRVEGEMVSADRLELHRFLN